MATFSVLGVGSGLDLQGLLSKLMAVEQTPITTLQSKVSKIDTQISLYGTIQSKLSALQSAADVISFPSSLNAVSATPADTGIATSSATFVAQEGTYNVNITELASAQKTVSQGYPVGTTFGGGTLSITFASDAIQHDIAISAGDKISDIASKVNAANIGIKASVISGTDGDHLVLTGANSGADNAFTFSSSQITEDPALKVIAKDAAATIDGISISSSTNTFSGQINGLTINAVAKGQTTITVKTDNTTVVDAVQSFVDAYNAVVSEIKKDTAYDSTNKTSQPLTGDSIARSILNSLNSVRTTMPSSLSGSSIQSLSAFGVTVQQDGTLSLNSSKLTNALNSSTNDTLAAINAFGQAFSNKVSDLLGTNGVVTNRVSGLTATRTRYENNISDLEIRVAMIQKQYEQQFSKLDQLVTSYSTTSSYLTQIFSSWSNSSSSS